ncbi:phosphoglycolate phosphatase, partial [Burkholderia multivorans]
GDDLRDIQAGYAAGMATVAAAYGYCGDGAAPGDWRAQHLVGTTGELRDLLRDVAL